MFSARPHVDVVVICVTFCLVSVCQVSQLRTQIFPVVLTRFGDLDCRRVEVSKHLTAMLHWCNEVVAGVSRV